MRYKQNLSARLAYQLKASVVKVHVATKSGGHGVGTGVVVGKDLVATNCHVLANSRGVKIAKFGDSFIPEAMKADWKHDICIMRFKYLDLTPVVLEILKLKLRANYFFDWFSWWPA